MTTPPSPAELPLRALTPDAVPPTLEAAVEGVVLQAMLESDQTRRRFLGNVSRGVAASVLAASFPLEAAQAVTLEAVARLEKRRLRIGYVPITCSAPLIAAEPLEYYAQHGLEVELVRTAGWAVARDKCLSGEFDASHLLAPMPLAMTLGVGSPARPFIVPAMQNTNGQAIVLARKHVERRDPRQWKGFRLAVPYEYSMHNFLLRYYLSQHGVDPDRHVSISVTPPPLMVETLSSGLVDGYLAPDPYCQRAVYDGIGFIHLLTKEILSQHPCCAFGCTRQFAEENPNTFLALFRAVLGSINFCAAAANRIQVAQAIHGEAYLDQPLDVVTQVMTGRYEDGLGNQRYEPDRIHFAPLPTQAMAQWILTQMKRWGYLKADQDYGSVAHQVYLTLQAERLLDEMNETGRSGDPSQKQV